MKKEYNGDYNKIGRKLLDKDSLPEGPLTRYIRDLYAFGLLTGKVEKSISFEEFKNQWEENYDKECARRNIENPILYNKTFKLGKFKSIRIFKRRGEEFHCVESDVSPYGGDLNISLDKALSLIGNEKVREEVSGLEK